MIAGFWHWPFRRLLPFMLVMLLGFSSVALGVATRTASASATPFPSAPALLDLAWLMPVPSDVPVAGYQLLFGHDSASLGLSPDQAGSTDVWGKAFLAAVALPAWQQAYVTILSHPDEKDWRIADQRIEVTVVQFIDDAGGTAGLAAMRAVFEEHGYEAVSTPFTLGADGVLVRGHSADSPDRPAASLLGVTRLDNLVVAVHTQDYAGVPPDAALPVTLVTRMASQLPAVLAGQTPNLSHRIVRLAPPDDTGTRGMTEVDRYLRRNDIQLPDPWPEDSDMARAMERFAGEHQIQDWYRYDATRMRPGMSLTCVMDVFQFQDVAAATAYFPRTASDVAAYIAEDRDNAEDLQVVAPAADIGADALLGTYRIARATGDSYGGEGWVRIGNAVTRMFCNGFPEQSETTMSHLLQEAIACLETACPSST